MSYLREEAETHALTVLRKVIKGDGRLAGIFYLASKSPTGPVGLVCETFVRDRRGTKTLQKGMKMRRHLKKSSPAGDPRFVARGVVEIRDGVLEFKADYRKGNLELLKRATFKDLAQQATPTAKKLSRLFRKARFLTPEGDPDEAVAFEDGEDAVVEPVGDDIADLDLDDVDIADALRLAPYLSEQLGMLEQVLGTEGASDDAGDEAALRLGLASLRAQHQALKRILAGYAPGLIPSPERAALRARAEAELVAISELLESGSDPFPDVGEAVDEDTRILLDILTAQVARRQTTHGRITLGDEAEVTGGYRAVTPHRVGDHTCLFITDSGVEVHYETQGGKVLDPKSGGIIEAITHWVYIESEAGKALNARQVDAIQQMKEVFEQNLDGVTPQDLVTLMAKRGVTIQLSSELPDGLRFGAGKQPITRVGLAPQVTVTHRLANFAAFMRNGYPDVTSTKGKTYRDAVMADSIRHGELALDAVLEAEGTAIESLPDDAEAGEKMRAVLGLLAQDLTARLVRSTATKVHGRQTVTWYPAEGAPQTRTLSYAKDIFGVLPKTPLPILVQEGGLSAPEIDLLFQHQDVIVSSVEALFVQQRQPQRRRERLFSNLTLEEYVDAVFRKPFGRNSPKLYQEWLDKQISTWRKIVGDDGTAPIVAKDQDGTVRLATEIRQPTLELAVIQDRILAAMQANEQARFAAAAQATLSAAKDG